ncbi:MarR family winged helix-turn-helix transcriptional regulator [Heyndrickxia oleronia]|jgi:DNA-binding MarR family transcriptional regulator|uniref:MarR family transcriptional regulator n=1 Tax=Heyndrickxia oleronia TaxID=38875 RepID=A0A8E2I7H0_9BACI|nr:MarR family transcriptional regulator [Heyndrickxia oleronia]NYV64793.1 MarR family transcriptional regulator [Bacillus sp. Gen3]OJH19292.1 MarR family transcriptional regulator [Bacillus obstructivus]MBU5210530.1 MarR family transcriptional regulator [Heyndrickxia oleronia]MCI1593289.1 MarR family transcriptional regulator [Heyndrickxia oleronia]MCI1613528.1 MarR family transcriptional regulator [Heyndrickxia oleronia]
MSNHLKINEIKQIEYELTTLIRRAVYLEQNKKIGNIDRALYLLLRKLDEDGPANSKSIAKTFHLDISTVSRQTTTLESLGFIQRFSDPNDKRVSLFQITDEGRQALREDIEKRLDKYTNMLDTWSILECETFKELLTRMNQALIDEN